MASKLLDPTSDDTKPVFLRTVYDYVSNLSEADRRKHRVLKIRLLKEAGFVGHEFLILDVFDGTNLLRLLAERRPSRRPAEKPRHRMWTFNLHKVDLLVSDGDDIIKRVPEDFSPSRFHLVTTLSADTDDAPTFAFVCKIMWEMQEKAPNYLFFRRQCYWFAGTTIERLKPEFTRVAHGPEAKRQGKPGRTLGMVPVFTEQKAAQHVTGQIKEEADVKRKEEKMARQQMRDAAKSAIIMANAERRKSMGDMQRAVQPLLTTPEARQRSQWSSVMAGVEEEFQKSRENLQSAARALIEIPASPQADGQYWQSVFRNAITSGSMS